MFLGRLSFCDRMNKISALFGGGNQRVIQDTSPHYRKDVFWPAERRVIDGLAGPGPQEMASPISLMDFCMLPVPMAALTAAGTTCQTGGAAVC